MKKWSLIVALLYGAMLFVLFVPLAYFAFAPSPKLSGFVESLSRPKSWTIFFQLGPWTIFFIIVTAQFALLRTPVAIARGKPVAQMSIWITVVTAALMMGLLVLGGGLSAWESMTNAEGTSGLWLAVLCSLASWIFWIFYFRKIISNGRDMPKLQKCMWKGSILELLVAVPTHVVARQRDYCCAGCATFVGLVCGLSVMLFAFGPGIYFLFIERWKRLHPQPK